MEAIIETGGLKKRFGRVKALDGLDLTVAPGERLVLGDSRRVGRKYPDLVVHKVLITDEPAKALAEAAKNAQLLVLGSRGRGGIKRLLLGSTAHAVLAQLSCPTIITRVRRVKNTK